MARCRPLSLRYTPLSCGWKCLAEEIWPVRINWLWKGSTRNVRSGSIRSETNAAWRGEPAERIKWCEGWPASAHRKPKTIALQQTAEAAKIECCRRSLQASQMIGAGGTAGEGLQLTQSPQARLYSGAAGSPRQPLQYHAPIGDLATHQRPGQGKAPLLRQLRLTACPMAIATLQGLKAPQAVATAAAPCDRAPARRFLPPVARRQCWRFHGGGASRACALGGEAVCRFRVPWGGQRRLGASVAKQNKAYKCFLL